MVALLRRLTRLIAILTTTAFLYTIYLVTRRKRIVRLWMSAMARILGVRVDISGSRPTGAFLLVSNHLGFLDILVLGAATGVVFVAKSEIAGWPGLGQLASITGTIYIDRRSPRDAIRVSETIANAVRGGTAVAIFPEGQSTDGSSVLPFKAALLESAAREQLPVHPATLHYDRDEAKWYGDETFGANFWRLLAVPRVNAALRFGDAIRSHDRKELARLLHAVVSFR
jgi:1-acyl-sn-glycerol-3-phosphate acyltransferase